MSCVKSFANLLSGYHVAFYFGRLGGFSGVVTMRDES